jgi:hypothetical protein
MCLEMAKADSIVRKRILICMAYRKTCTVFRLGHQNSKAASGKTLTKAKADLDAIFGLANVPREVSVQASELLREIS